MHAPQLEPIPKSAVTVEAIKRIKDMIRMRQLRPGDRLPPERELAARLAVSRNSLREAIRALGLMNILHSRQGDGTYVTSLEPELLIEPIRFILQLDEHLVFHLFEVRRFLESAVARLAAERITDSDLAELEGWLDRLRQHEDDPKTFIEDDVGFHGAVLRAARNPIMTSVMASVSQLAVEVRSRTVGLPHVPHRTIRDHTAVFDALRSRDPYGARDSMEAHIRHVEESFRAALGPAPG